jgi:hypothetical protein
MVDPMTDAQELLPAREILPLAWDPTSRRVRQPLRSPLI